MISLTKFLLKKVGAIQSTSIFAPRFKKEATKTGQF